MRAEAAGRRWEELGGRTTERGDSSPPMEAQQQQQQHQQQRWRPGGDGSEDGDGENEDEEAGEGRAARALSPVAEEVGGVGWLS